MSTNELGKFQRYIKIKKLSSKLSQSGYEAALVTSETNIRYLTEFPNSEGSLLILRDHAYLLVDFRYGEAVKAAVTNADVIVYTKYYETLNELIEKHRVRDLMIEADVMTVSQMEKLERKLSCRVTTNDRLDKLISIQRMIKSHSEIEKIKTAQRIAEDSLVELLNIVKPGVTEKKLAFELEYLMRKRGASGVSFDLITIAGANTSKPHGVPGDYTLKNGDFVTFDIGALYEGYHSDMTRTFVLGSATEKQTEIYNIVLKAQLQGVKKVRAGIKAYEVDAAARSVIARAGYGDYFGHSTGHGVGLDIHEQPFVSSKGDVLLSEGMVITVEPGIYLPGEFGVRIEDMVVVTKDGCDNLATMPKELMEL